AGLPALIVGFFESRLDRTAASFRGLGRLFGGAAEQRAEDFATLHEARVAEIEERISSAETARQSVLLQSHPGRDGWSCCWMPGGAGLGQFIQRAGGNNVGAPLGENLPWLQVSREFVLQSNPDLVIATGGPYMADRGGLCIGPGVAHDVASRTLALATGTGDISLLPAVQRGN